MKTILLVDDDAHSYRAPIGFVLMDKGIESFVIDSGNAYDPEEALGMIRAYPEADFILLDGYLARGNCKAVVSELTQEEIAKVICFSGDPGDFFSDLRLRGVIHFPGKHGRYWNCVSGTCSCAHE